MKTKLLKLLDESGFISGEKIADHLDISRTAVWKQINTLKKHGYKIESQKNKGYKLLSRPDIPTPEEIQNNLKTKIMGKKIHYFKEINSTNFFAKQLIGKKPPEGTIIISEIQTKGRGRKQRTWASPKGGLWFSTILYPKIPPERGMLITMTCSVAIAEAIKELTNLEPVIKWPNDLLLNGKKICGILTEFDAEIDKINYVIVGIGINVNNKISDDLKKVAISIKQAYGKQISLVNLIREIIQKIDEKYIDLKSEDFESIKKSWLNYSKIINRKISVHGEKDVLTGIVTDIDNSGCLILKTDEGFNKIISGDVTYL